MTSTEMEQALENLDRRLAHIEQILPTLASKDDLKEFATTAQLSGVGSRMQAQMESLHDDVRKIAEGYQSLYSGLESLGRALRSLTTRLERKGVI